MLFSKFYVYFKVLLVLLLAIIIKSNKRLNQLKQDDSALKVSTEITNTTFSYTFRFLATGSGDTTMRLWDLSTETPRFTCSGHRREVMVVSWSPDGLKVATGAFGEVRTLLLQFEIAARFNVFFLVDVIFF